MSSILKHIPRVFEKDRCTPLYLIFFVTSKCDASCKHCFYWEKTNKIENELSLSEIKEISRNMGDILQLTLTGGDACIRDDLSEIVSVFYKNNNVMNVSIGTNGYRTEKVVSDIEKILNSCKNLNISVDLSIDGMGKQHDRIRNLDGLFEKVCETHGKLNELKKFYPRLSTNIDITISHFNQKNLIETYLYIRDKLKPDVINCLLLRGDVKDKKSFDFDIKYYEELCNWIERDVRLGAIRGYGFFRDMLNMKDIYLRNIAIRIFKENRYLLPCYAGRSAGVLYPDGEVYPCELRSESFGNVRGWNYDFRKLWFSDGAREIKNVITDTKCFCYHQCFLTNNILFNPRIVGGIFVDAFKHRIGRLLHS